LSHPFIVGERYIDRRGEYLVTGINGKRLIYRYDDGTEATGLIEDKARIYRNILAERRAVHPYQSPDYFQSLGFLARHAEFQAEVPPQARASFEENYYLSTGRRPTLHRDGYYPIEIETTYDKWAPELRIYFPEYGGRLDLPPEVEVRPGNTEGALRINSNQFWWRLVRVGFRLGTNHDIRQIRETIPPDQRARFELGFSS
jgi:hypothetical protein